MNPYNNPYPHPTPPGAIPPQTNAGMQPPFQGQPSYHQPYPFQPPPYLTPPNQPPPQQQAFQMQQPPPQPSYSTPMQQMQQPPQLQETKQKNKTGKTRWNERGGSKSGRVIEEEVSDHELEVSFSYSSMRERLHN